MNILLLAGRVLFALPFILFSLGHFIYGTPMTGLVPEYLPGGVIWVYIAGLVLLTGGILILINKYARAGGIIIGVLMLIFVITVHYPGIMDQEITQIAISGFFKDLALSGGAFFIAAVSNNE
jgi:putative oxidoreductase